MHSGRNICHLSAVLLMLGSASVARADDDSVALAKKLSNPVAALISIPFQFNYDNNIGPNDGHRLTTNIQPVIPIPLDNDWKIISRTILPVISQSGVIPGSNQFGLGDVTQSFFFSPNSTGPIWGVGPAFLIPTATDDALGAKQFSAGPTGILLEQVGPWTYGMLANQLWSVAGPQGSGAVNTSFVQPFMAYTTHEAWTFSLNSEANYDWTARDASIPIDASISKLVRFGKLPVSFQGGVGYWADSSRTGPEGWRGRFTVTFLLPES